MSAVDFFVICDGVANVAMAIAAIAALTLWRKQVTGASQHQLAKEVAGALRLAAVSRREMIIALRRMGPGNDDINGMLGRALASESLRRNGSSLGDAVEKLEELEGQIAIQWGDTVVELVAVIRQECKGLFIHAAGVVTPHIKGRPHGYLSIGAPPGIAPSYTGRAFERALDLYTELTQQWLAVHIGRDGARSMDLDELTERRKQIDAEVERLAEPERTVNKEKHDEWLAAIGGIEGLRRLISEQQADEQKTE